MRSGDLNLEGELQGAERLREAERGVPSRIRLRRGVEFGYSPGLIESILPDASPGAIAITFRRFLPGVLIGSSSSSCSSSSAVYVRGIGAAPLVISA
jgi:hypothetical protein